MSTIKLEKFVNASPAEIYSYFTNSTALRDWICDIATADPHPGGHLYLCWTADYYTSGEYIKLEKDKSVSFTWFGKGEPHKTQVSVRLKKQKGGTLVNLIHRGMGKSQKWESIAAEYKKQWQNGLDNLASVLGEGPDLRITRRPMLGITIGEFNPEIAVQLRIPVNYGLRLSGVVDGMGAQKAGLLADDVIVAVDGQELEEANTFNSIIRTKHAGDQVDIFYYRGAEKIATNMTLSGRPIPTIPATPLELSKQLTPIYKQFEDELDTILQSTNNEESSKKPGMVDWSVNEVLAHLIHSELGWQNIMYEMIGGYEGAYDGYGGNLQAHIDGTITAYPTAGELFKALKTHHLESLSMIAHIPDEFLTQKGKYWKLVFSASQNPYHYQTHLEQMRKAIANIRKN